MYRNAFESTMICIIKFKTISRGVYALGIVSWQSFSDLDFGLIGFSEYLSTPFALFLPNR